VALLLPRSQVFERLLLVGIGVHFFTQALIMSAGTLNLMPLTGVTLPFLSLGGASFMVNLVEVGLALTLMGRAPLPQATGATGPLRTAANPPVNPVPYARGGSR
jgi:cell division protein FtsW (lipid II flippase)